MIAVVIPTLNEETELAGCLEALRGLDGDPEVVVADGGSRDRTREVARAAGARVVESEAGRGRQLAAGVAGTSASTLLFLHADTRLPENALDIVPAVLARPGVCAGAFTLTFDDPRWRFRLAERLVDLRSRRLGRPWGDQALFSRRVTYDAVGGFPPWPILEDVELARRLRCLGRIEVVAARVTTSARRYRAGGLLATAARNQLILALWALGVPAERLVSLYRTVR